MEGIPDGKFWRVSAKGFQGYFNIPITLIN
jgi:hypothetical protein